MESFVGAALDAATKRADGFVASARRKFMAGGGSASTIGGFGGTDNRAKSGYRRFGGTVYSAIRAVAQRIAGQPIRIGRRMGVAGAPKSAKISGLPQWLKSASYDVEPVYEHPLLDLFCDPNEIMVDWHLKYVTSASLLLTGRSYWWLVNPVRGRQQIWPVPTSWVTPIHDEGRMFNRYEVRLPSGAGDPIQVSGDDMAHFYFPDPSDPKSSVSPTEALRLFIETDNSINTAQDRAFKNGIHPGTLIVAGRHPDIKGMPGERPALTRVQKLQLIEGIRQNYQGALNSGEPFIVDAMIEDVKPFTMAPREMDFRNSGEYSASRVSEGFGVNRFMLGRLEGASRASSAVADQHFVSMTTNPIIELLSQVMTAWVSQRVDKSLVVFIEPCVPNDPELRIKENEILAKHGAITINELRCAYNYAPIDGGDEFVGGGEESKSRRDRVARKSTKFARRGFFVKSLESVEKEYKAKLGEFFEAQSQAVMKEIDRLWPTVNESEVFRPEDWEQPMKDLAEPFILRGIVLGAVGYDVSVKGMSLEQIVATIRELGGELAGEIIEHIRNGLSSIMSAGFWRQIGLTTSLRIGNALRSVASLAIPKVQALAQIAESLSSTFGASRIAAVVDSTIRSASSIGSYAASRYYAARGIVRGNQWTTMADAKVRSTHAILHGERRAVGQTFNVGGFEALHPRDSSLPDEEFYGCRCWLEPIVLEGPEDGDYQPNDDPDDYEEESEGALF